MTSPIAVNQSQAACFLIRATGLEAPFASVGAALGHLGFVQIDPINVCGRMQDHILRNRVQGYHEQDLMRHLHANTPCQAFEHHLPDSHNLAALPLDAWPHLQKAMRSRVHAENNWLGKLSAEEQQLAEHMLDRLKSEGPLCSQDIKSARKEKSYAWDSTTLAKGTLQKLFFHGRVLIARREGIRRYYALPENVLPSATLNAPEPTSEETTRWLAKLKLRQRRMAILKTAEQRALADDILPVIIQGANLRVHILKSDLPVLETPQTTTLEPKLIAPLDPIIYDRKVAEAVWAFNYRWEVYVPPQKRVRGYYALPLLHKRQFIGHVDLKADRKTKLLHVISQHPTRSNAAKLATASLAAFLGLKSSV